MKKIKNNEEIEINIQGNSKKNKSANLFSKEVKKKKSLMMNQKKSDVLDLSSLSSDFSDLESAENLLMEIEEEEKKEKIKELENSIQEQEKNLKKDEISEHRAIIHQKTAILPIQLSSDDEIKLIVEEESKLIKRCPKCNNKLKKKWVKKNNDIYFQKIKCKGKGFLFWKIKCDFEKEIKVRL